MFKLLAIRPLEGCADYIQKCLKTGMMYYFCNDYIIEPGSHIRRRSKNIKPLKEDFFTVVPESDYSEDNSSERKSPTVSVSAIVGMNGDGKSTLVELMIRLINNCAISYELCASSDNSKGENDNKTEPHYNLRRVKNAKAELYYMIDNVVYRMAEEKDQKDTRIWKVLELNPFNEKGEELMRWEIDSVEIQKVEDDPKGFFFTIVSNYSHYAYNIYDYEKEWEIRGGEKNDDEKCWLHYIYHKNDDYLTPITLYPYRYKGNIDINVEKDLSKQRLLSLFLNADNPVDNPLSFRRVNGKDANILKLMDETESKLQQKTIVEYFEMTIQENRFSNLLEELDKVNDEIFQASTLTDSSGDYYKDYNTLVEYILPTQFINPINDIIHNEDFSAFANQLVDWIKPKIKNKKAQKSGDIMAVMRGFEKLQSRNKAYFKIEEFNEKAKENISEGNYVLALKYYSKAKDKSESIFGKDHYYTAQTYINMAVAYEEIYEYEKAIEYFRKALDISEKTLGVEHPDTATIYNDIGMVYNMQGDYIKALDYLCKALDIREKILGVEHIDTATNYNNIGMVYYMLGDYNVASEYLFKALAIRENVLGMEHPDTASTLNAIGVVYVKREGNDNALGFFSKALAIRENVLGMEHPDTAITYNNIGVAYSLRGDYKNALDNFRSTLTIRKVALGMAHPDTATIYNNIGVAYSLQGDYVNALENFNNALTIRKKALGMEHPDTDTTYNNIGEVYKMRGEYEQALENFNNALTIRKKALGMEHSETATIYNNIGEVYNTKGEYELAIENFSKALAIWEKVGEKEYPDTATAYNNIGIAYNMLGEYEQALENFSKALLIREKTLGIEHPNTASTLNALGVVCSNRQDYDDALEYYRKALKIMEKVFGGEHPVIAILYDNIAWTYVFENELENALKQFSNAKSIREKVLGEHFDIAKSYDNIAWVYDLEGDHKKELDYHEKAVRIREAVKDKTHTKSSIENNNKSKAQKDINAFSIIMDQKEWNVLIQQLKLEFGRSDNYSSGEDMNDVLKDTDRFERKIKNKQKLLDTKKHGFLNFINATQLGRLDTLYRIMKNNNIDWRIVVKDYSLLTLKEKCEQYKVYEIWSIINTYPQFKDAFVKEEIESLREFGKTMEKCIESIKKDNTHITRKLRQVDNFLNEKLINGGLYERLGKRNEDRGDLQVEIDKLKEHYEGKSFSLDKLPPPIYKWDIIFKKKDDIDCDIDIDSFSSGEKQMLNTIGANIYHLQNVAKSSSEVKYGNVNLIMEEIELYYHPEYQRLFFSRLLDLIQRANLENIQNINIIFVTHSPFILSDIPKCNVLFLKDGMPDDELQENTFGANIHSLLKHGFFMPNLPIGEFAYEKINALFKKLNSGDFNNDNDEEKKKDLDDIYQQILLVGEPFLRNQLLLLYNSFKGSK